MEYMRELVDSLSVHCPVCTAKPKEKCEMESGFPRFESHIERGWIAAMGHLKCAPMLGAHEEGPDGESGPS